MLLVRAGALGDLLLLRPAIHALKRAGHHVTLLAPGKPAAAILGRGTSEVDAVLDWEGAEMRGLLSGNAVPASLRGYDSALALTRSADLVSALADAIPAVQARDPSPPPGTHAAEWLANVARDLTEGPVSIPPPIEPDAAELAQAQPLAALLPRCYLALHAGSGSAAKNWPAERYAAVAQALAPSVPFLLVQGPADKGPSAVLRAAGPHVIADELPLRVLGALLARAGLYVGNDSGVTHLAAAYGAPTLALFGPSSAATWAPVGPRVRTLSAADGRMESLALEAVLAAAALTRETPRA